jgi:hypothetical protein
MTYIYGLINILEQQYIYFSLITIVISLAVLVISKNNPIGFSAVFIIFMIIGYLNNIYPIWLVLGVGMTMMTFSIFIKFSIRRFII